MKYAFRQQIFTQGNSGAVNTRHWLDGADLLSYQELKQLFPERKIYSEKILGMSKSFIII